MQSKDGIVLVMDVGNTHIVIGVYREDTLLQCWRLHTNPEATEDEYGMMLKDLLHHIDCSYQDVRGVVISSVVPPLAYVMRKLTEKYIKISPLILKPDTKTGLLIHCENPRELGADRIANAVAAIHQYGVPVIVVDFGTATTFCFIDEEGKYRGGAIAPGVHISAEALYQSAAKLTRVELARPQCVVGENTVQAVQAGVYFGYVSMVDGIVTRMKEKMPKKPKVVATGGLARLICRDTETIDEVNPSLTLEGLKLIYDQHQESMDR